MDGGGAAAWLTIRKAHTGPDFLPRTSTCFATLYLPDYPTKEALERKLALASEEQGFGLA